MAKKLKISFSVTENICLAPFEYPPELQSSRFLPDSDFKDSLF
eukprot:SAG11_NODE_16727_length_539_cov_1.052273_1_plen_42_part_10